MMIKTPITMKPMEEMKKNISDCMSGVILFVYIFMQYVIVKNYTEYRTRLVVDNDPYAY